MPTLNLQELKTYPSPNPTTAHGSDGIKETWNQQNSPLFGKLVKSSR